MLAAAAVLVGVLTRPVTRPAAAGRAPVAAVLAAAAVRAAHGAGAGRPPGPGQYLYVNEVVAKGLGSAQGCADAPMTVQAWVAADGSGRQIGSFPARCGQLNFDQSYRKGGLPWQLYGYVKAGSLPTEPTALQRAIVQRFEHGRSRPSATFVYAATFLNAGSPPALRAALYQVIESLPGVQNLGPATDRLGRPGQAIGLVTAGARAELIFDPATTSVLEEETVAVAPAQAGNNQLPRRHRHAVHAVCAPGPGQFEPGGAARSRSLISASWAGVSGPSVSAAAFCSAWATVRMPGMGTVRGLRASSQPSAPWARVRPPLVSTSRTASSRASQRGPGGRR